MADFTEIYKQSKCVFSPNGEYIATAVQQRLVIRETFSLQIVQLYNCEEIQDLLWSPDSDLVVVCCYKIGSFQVFSVSDEAWTAQIDEGIVGCSRVIFAPDSRHLLSFSNFELRITIWSLVTKEALYIQFPKCIDRGYQFRSDGSYFCLLERYDSQDFLSIFDTVDWTLTKRFSIDTIDAYDLAWSPDGRFIAVWESMLDYKVYIYHPDGRLAATYSAYDNGLGIKQVQWSPSGQFLGIGSFDQTCRLLNHLTWTSLVELEHPKTVKTLCYREIDLSENPTGQQTWSNAQPKLQFEIVEGSIQLPYTKPDIEKPNAKVGISKVLFNATGSLLITFNESQPKVIWVWDIPTLQLLCVIQQTVGVKSIEWNPLQPEQFAYCCGNGLVYIWERKFGCDAIQVPAISFCVEECRWNPDGRSLLVLDKNKFCLSFLVDE